MRVVVASYSGQISAAATITINCLGSTVPPNHLHRVTGTCTSELSASMQPFAKLPPLAKELRNIRQDQNLVGWGKITR